MATQGTWRRRGSVIVAATTVIGSITIWATQVATATPATAATVQANPYFAGAVTNPPVMKQRLGSGAGKLYTESAAVSFIVPTVTCSATTQDTPYTIFQNLEGGPGESGFAALLLDCTSGTLSAAMLTYANTESGSSGGCDTVAVNPGDSISFSEQDYVNVQRGLLPTGLINLQAFDRTNGESTECSSPTTLVPDGPVYTGFCDSLPMIGPIPRGAPPFPPIQTCGSTKVPAFAPFVFSRVKVDTKPFWRWPTDEYDMYRYRQAGSILKPIEQVQTQRVGDAMDFTFLHS
jgi:hypothetical protein